MSDPRQTVRISPWLGGSVLTLLVLQLGLLWVQGSLVQRQRQDILGLREDVQAMAESLDEDAQSGDPNLEARPVPARLRLRLRSRLKARAVRATYFQAKADDDEQARKDLDATKDSAKAAVAKARDLQKKTSITENIRLADETAKMNAEGRTMRPWLWAGAGLALLLMIARSLRRRD